jgi:signal transduction histidine kinase
MAVDERASSPPLRLVKVFTVASLLIIIAGGIGIGLWVVDQIERGVINESALTTAMYIDSMIAPHLPYLDETGSLSPEHAGHLNELLTESTFSQRIATFKIFIAEGQLLYSDHTNVIGQVFPVTKKQARAWQGDVVASIIDHDDPHDPADWQSHDRLLEIYVPIRSFKTSQILAVAEFYHEIEELQAEILLARQRSWFLVGGVMSIIYFLLVGTVRFSGKTIERQHRELQDNQLLLETRVAERTHILNIALEFTQEVVKELDFLTLYKLITKKTKELFKAETSSMCLFAEDGRSLELVSSNGETIEEDFLQNLFKGMLMDPSKIGDGTPAMDDLFSHCTLDCEYSPDHCLYSPLFAGGQIIGALCIVRQYGKPFDENEIRSFSLLTNSASMAITKLHLLELSRRQAHQATIVAERDRLAAELHDNLAQTMILLKLKAQHVGQLVEGDKKPVVEEELVRIYQAADKAYAQIRGMLLNLNQPADQGKMFPRELEDFVAEFTQNTGLPVELCISENCVLDLNHNHQKQAMLILREALFNVHRHSHASAARIEISTTNSWVQFLVHDNGVGFNPSQQRNANHYGLGIMKVRAERCGGRFTVQSAPGEGATITVTIPISPEVD